MDSAADILATLDEGCERFVFPMLDNGYVYLGATRLSLFRSPTAWALVNELWGYSPRAGLPDLSVRTFGSAVEQRDEHRILSPLDDGDWRDPDEQEVLSADPEAEYVLRGVVHRVPERWEYARVGVELIDPERVMVFELCRYLAAMHRDDVLATGPERRAKIADDMDQLLVLDDWHHPDLAADERPSELDSFQQLAYVLETGDASSYRPRTPGNTHWKNWPEGGSL